MILITEPSLRSQESSFLSKVAISLTVPERNCSKSLEEENGRHLLSRLLGGYLLTFPGSLTGSRSCGPSSCHMSCQNIRLQLKADNDLLHDYIASSSTRRMLSHFMMPISRPYHLFPSVEYFKRPNSIKFI